MEPYPYTKQHRETIGAAAVWWVVCRQRRNSSFKSITVKRLSFGLHASRRQRGQSLVEMALVLPFLVVIMLGTIELGYYVYTYSELEYATRRASERALKEPPLNPSSANSLYDRCVVLIKADAIGKTTLNQLNANNIVLTLPNGRNVGEIVRVEVTYTGQFLTPIGNQFFGNAMNFNFISQRTITNTPSNC